MSQTYNQLQHFANKFNESIRDKKCQIQKIMSSPVALSFQMRIPGETLFLSLGRGDKYMGIWRSDAFPPSESRVRGRFLEYVRKYLRGAQLKSIEVDVKDRCFYFDYMGKIAGKMAFFLKGKNLYFANCYEKDEKIIAYCSWRKKSIEWDSDDIFSIFDGVGRREIEKRDSSVNDLFSPDIKVNKKNRPQKKKKRLNRKLMRIKDDLKRVAIYRELQKVVDDEVCLLEATKLLKQARIKVIRDEGFYKLRDKVFKKIKSFKQGEAILLERMNVAVNDLHDLETNKEIQSEIRDAIQPVWSMEEKKTVVSKMDFDVIELSNLVKVGIGLSAKGNDDLRKNFGSKEDFWFHIADTTSSHAILKGASSNEILSFVPKIAALIAKHSSIASGDYVELIYTQVKNLKSMKGRPGTVKYSKIKFIRQLVEEIE